MRFGWKAKDALKRTQWIANTAAILFVLIYTLIYWFEPFSEFWNVVLSNLFLQIASLVAALIAFSIYRLYDKSDAPRRVWGPFAIALFLWFMAEVIWGIINVTQGEVSIGWPDVFWVAGYPVLALALFSQYQILSGSTPRDVLVRSILAAIAMIVLAVVNYVVITSLAGSSSTLSALINSFYPVADILLAVIAFRLIRKFSGGAFSRPWLGLFVFAFSDLIYAWLEITGMYTWSIEQGNLLTTISDVVYLSSYLVMCISLLYQWLFLKYGMRPQ